MEAPFFSATRNRAIFWEPITSKLITICYAVVLLQSSVRKAHPHNICELFGKLKSIEICFPAKEVMRHSLSKNKQGAGPPL
jgi:hypothetical protein